MTRRQRDLLQHAVAITLLVLALLLVLYWSKTTMQGITEAILRG